MVFPLKYSTVASRFNCTFSSIHQFDSQKNHQILLSLLGKSTSIKELKQIHTQIIVNGLTHHTLAISKLISFCAITDTRYLDYAQLIFDQITKPNKFMYNTLIRGYSNSNDPIKSIILYRQMIGSGFTPNEFTLPFVLKACASKLAFWVSLIVHGHSKKLGLWCNVYVQNGLIGAFLSCGFIHFAQKVFDYMPERTLVSWNLMIGGYAKMGSWKEVFLLFKDMREIGIQPNNITSVNLLTVCSHRRNIDLGRFVHVYIEIKGMEIDLIVKNALLDMYAKCGDLRSAERLFNQMSEKNVVSWTSMISAYAKHGLIGVARKIFDRMPVKNLVSWNSMLSCHVQAGQCKEALSLFHEMHKLGVMPDETTLVSVLSACSHIGDLVTGKKIHSYICGANGLNSVNLWNSVIDMYAKCGALGLAIDVFNEMPSKNLVSWNTIIGGLALHGCGLEAIKLFEKMQAEGICPDEITFTGLLSACSHNGLVDAGQKYFYEMRSVYGIAHEIEHYACMVDLVGRRGHFNEAMMLVRAMPMKPDIVIWGALLGACRTYGNVWLGKQILKQLLELNPYSSGVYVLLSNLFSEAGKLEDMKKIRKLMNANEIIKCRGISSIEIEGFVYEFMVDDNRLETASNLHSLLDQLTDHMTSIGYFCNFASGFSKSQDTNLYQ